MALRQIIGPLWVACLLRAVAARPVMPSTISDLSSSSAEGNVFVNRAATPSGAAIDRTSWTYTADSYQAGNEVKNAFDGSSDTFWHTLWTPTTDPLPNNITIDMKNTYNVHAISYLPRQDGRLNGNIGQHKVFLSRDGVNWGASVAIGTYMDDDTLKSSLFEPAAARYVRIVVLSEAGGRGPWTSAAEINVYSISSSNRSGKGRWGETIDFPLVPVAAFIEPGTQNLLAWAAYSPIQFNDGHGGQTVTSTYDRSQLTVTDRVVSNTDHDMFCPGISLDSNGGPIVTGGNDAPKTSIYDLDADLWIAGPNMNIARAYQSSATCSDGRIFTIGGSWSGGRGGKNGEIYDPVANNWTLLPGAPVSPMLTDDQQGIFRADNHAWLFGWKNQSVFQAGPSKAMNWYGTSGTGNHSAAGLRGSDVDSMCGIAVMFDAVAGKILTVGGSIWYQDADAHSNAHLITIAESGTVPQVTTLASAAYARIFHNGVVLPNGQVFITGGQTYGNPFSDDNPVLTPELFDPVTNSFTTLAANSIPRTYHSFALLQPDATVISGGGGLCGNCTTNHFDAQIFYPPYLFDENGLADRPIITSVSQATIAVGSTLTVSTDRSISSMSLIRYGSATHTVNTDQRRIPLTLTNAGTNKYTVQIPGDPGIAIPGYWMLFAMTASGVPSKAATVQITT